MNIVTILFSSMYSVLIRFFRLIRVPSTTILFSQGLMLQYQFMRLHESITIHKREEIYPGSRNNN